MSSGASLTNHGYIEITMNGSDGIRTFGTIGNTITNNGHLLIMGTGSAAIHFESREIMV